MKALIAVLDEALKDFSTRRWVEAEELEILWNLMLYELDYGTDDEELRGWATTTLPTERVTADRAIDYLLDIRNSFITGEQKFSAC